MADILSAQPPTWHGKPLYVCPSCGTSRFTQDRLERHRCLRPDVGPMGAGMPAPQASATPPPAASATRAPTPDAIQEPPGAASAEEA